MPVPEVMNLFEELGIDPNNFTWEQLAACNNMDEYVNWFFDDYEQDEIYAANASQICYHCPVIRACHEWAIDNKAEGLHGGVYFSNGKIDANRNKNKTPAEWKNLEELIGKRLTK
jgi:hypothetical protein